MNPESGLASFHRTKCIDNTDFIFNCPGPILLNSMTYVSFFLFPERLLPVYSDGIRIAYFTIDLRPQEDLKPLIKKMAAQSIQTHLLEPL